MDDELEVIRPYSKRLGAYHWVHIADHDGAPLCGDANNAFVAELRPEMWDGKTKLCLDCACAQHQFSVNTLQAGQVRRYGPSEYIYDVIDLADERRDRASVLAFCQEHVKRSYTRDEMKDWSWPELKELSERKPGVWRYFVFEASTH
jgi:hypothetical protein